jgi:hypothetical protein
MNSGNLDGHGSKVNHRNIRDLGNEGNHCNQTVIVSVIVSVSNQGNHVNKGDISSIETGYFGYKQLW